MTPRLLTTQEAAERLGLTPGKRKNIYVAYVAEQFENDGSPVSTIVKGVKRAKGDANEVHPFVSQLS